MTYIIKSPTESFGPYVAIEPNGESFSYETELAKATQFDTVSEAIAAIVKREWWWGTMTGDEFTLARVENVGPPVYKETEL